MGKNPGEKGILVFPSGLQSGRVRGDWCELPSVRIAKIKSRARAWGRLWLEGLWSPLISANALFAALTAPLALFFGYLLMGPKKMIDKSEMLTIGALAAIAALPIWAAIHAFIIAPARVIASERLLGTWHGDRFIYHKPVQVFTTQWSPSDNGRPKEFKISDVEPGAVVDYKIEIDGPANRLNCIVLGAYMFSPLDGILPLARFALEGRVKLGKGRRLTLLCHSLPNTVPAIVRVSILGWAVDPTTCVDYTDTRTQARIVICAD
jgi:hypothetical protein